MPLHEVKATVWYCLTSTFVFRPYFFEEVSTTCVKSCSVTSIRYKSMLQNYVISEFQKRNVLNGIVWMENRALPHVRRYVRPIYINSLVIESFPFTLQFHHFNPPTFLRWVSSFWGYLQYKVYTHGPWVVSKLKGVMKLEVIQISGVILCSSSLSTISYFHCVVTAKIDKLET